MEIVKHYGRYNARRYSVPWVCKVKDNGSPDFATRVGGYSGRAGEEGDLVVFGPQAGQVYAYGQKDKRKDNSDLAYVVWLHNGFIPCDRYGKTKVFADD